jgi:hypothetical protein
MPDLAPSGMFSEALAPFTYKENLSMSFDPANPETYPPELKRWHSAAVRVQTKAREAMDSRYTKDADYILHEAPNADELMRFFFKWQPLGMALAYMTHVSAANVAADSGDLETYLRLMSQATTYYNRTIRCYETGYDYYAKHDYVKLGGRLKESVANKRLNAAKYAADPMSKPLSFKPFTARRESGFEVTVSAAVVNGYAFYAEHDKWWIFHADTGLPFAKMVYRPYDYQADKHGCTKGIDAKKRAHKQIRPLAAKLPDADALREYGFRLTDGNGNAIE